ncbi:LEMD3 [Bugula neritina]|uniref:LEMD3 n=1 Tax=Bugula neritina TaxID=10212 RepID=A0A7J7JAY3_BUGNE|nr:LEMD3 [Bugula neritina]
MLLSISEIREKLYELTGDRYPITDGNKMLHARKLYKLLKSGRVADSVHNATAMEVSMPTETQFSDSDEEQMDFESSPVTTGDYFTPLSITNRPQLVSQAVNTSSFLDVTTPEVADADPDCFVLPSCSIQSDSTDDDIQISSNSPNFAEIPSRLSSPNLSSTRRSFVPPAPVTTSGTFFRKPMPPSPPRSVYARRPLRDNKFIPFNTEGSPRPVNRFRSTASAGDDSTRPDYATRFNTDGGRVLSEPRSKAAKVAKDVDMMIRDRGKSPSYVYSRALVIGLAMFLLTVLSYYAYLLMTAPLPLEQVFQSQDVYWPLIEKGTEPHSGSVTPPTIKPVTQLRKSGQPKSSQTTSVCTLLNMLVGRHECKWPDYTQGKVAVSVARHDMNIAHGKKVQHLWKPVLGLLFWNPLWKVRLASINQTSVKSAAEVAFLESEETAKPLSCVILNAMTSILTAVVAAFALAILGYLAYRYGRYRKQKMKEVDDLFYDLLENTIDMLENQLALSKDNPDEKPYLAISHVHDTLINPPDRNAMRGVWARVVKHMKENESRVREELQQVQGEEYLVWRLLQSTDSKTSPGSNRSRWVGTALRDSMAQKLNFTPKYCLKIRGMFDRRKVAGTEWALRIQDDILERLEPDHGVVHIAIGDELNENCVYIKLASRKHAGRAFQLLNGSYYEATGDCVQCKFMESSKYHQKFPHAEFTKVQVKKSTEQTLHSPRIYPSLS